MKTVAKNHVFPMGVWVVLLVALQAVVATAAAQQRSNDSQAAQRRADFEAEADTIRSNFYAYRDSVVQAYEAYEEELKNEFNGYVRSISMVWGLDSALTDTPTRWVEYSDDFRSRSIVDFDRGVVGIEVAVDGNASAEDVNGKLSEAVERMMTSRGSTCPWPSKVEKSHPITQKPIMDGLLDFSQYNINVDTVDFNVSETPRSGRPVAPAPVRRGRDLATTQTPASAATPGNRHLSKEREAAKKAAAERVASGLGIKTSETDGKNTGSGNHIAEKLQALREAARQMVEQSKIAVSTVSGADGVERTVVRVEMKMVADNLSKSAAMYRDIVAKYSQRFGIEQPLIFAIIEQESYFNPEATSRVPAYGLMQLVPRSGGYDAYRYVYGEEWIPTREYLFNPDNNICLGTAYLRVLFNQFGNVYDPDCRRLCVIASYNTGAGNVSRAFTGSTNLSRAFPSINALAYDALYNHLTTRLSTNEARNYVSGVSRRREKYIK